MFRNKALTGDHEVDTLIGRQTVFHGDLHFRGGLYIEGRVVGRLIAEDGADARLTLAEGGHIEGEVRAPVVVINGRLDGDVYAAERVELAPRARVAGNVHYQVVEMSAGAVLTGRLIHADTLGEAGSATAGAEPQTLHRAA